MFRTVACAMTGALALTAAAAVIALGSPVPAAADSIVIGGQPAHVKDSPWVVALSSRSHFGSTRAGQFCGAVMVAPTKALTAAHCLNQEELGTDMSQASDLRIIAGRDELNGTGGHEIAVKGTWVNPGYDPTTNIGDLAVLTLADALPQQSVISMAPAGDQAYEPAPGAVVYGWGDTTGRGDFSLSLRSAQVSILPDSTCERAYPGAGRGSTRPRRCSVRAKRWAGTTRAKETAEGRWSPAGDSSDWSPGGTVAGSRALPASTRGSPPPSGGWQAVADRRRSVGMRTGGSPREGEPPVGR